MVNNSSIEFRILQNETSGSNYRCCVLRGAWCVLRMGHTLVEIAGGLCTGVAIGFLVNALFS